MNRSIRLIRRLWLPLFLLASVSWLFAPAYYHAHYGTLKLISSYEAGALPHSWVFLVADVAAAGLLVSALWLFGLWQRDRIISWQLLFVGLLFAVDAICADRCNVQLAACHGLDLASTYVHDIESVMVAMVIVGLVLYHAVRYRHALSWGFLAVQGIFALLAVSGALDAQAIVVMQYTYEVLIMSWLAWLVSGYAPSLKKPTQQRSLRRVFAVVALVNGALAIAVALTHHGVLRSLFAVSPLHVSALVGQHAVIAGVFMLYLARHINLGQRRAAIILLMLFGSQVIKYSLITPSPVLLIFNLLFFVLLLYGRGAFDRNVLPLSFEHRIKDTAVVVGGVLAAVVLSMLLSSLFGWQQVVRHDLRATYQRPEYVARRDEDRLEARDSERLQAVIETLAAATLAAMAWSLFRPAQFRPVRRDDDRYRAEKLLGRYSTSTEDHFKIWPLDKSYYFSANGDGLVAYHVVGAVAFALADPVASAAAQPALLKNFVAMCRSRGWAVCFLLVQERSRALYADDLKIIKIGSSALIDIAGFVDKTSNDKWWRWQRNRARKVGLSYELLAPPHSAGLMIALRQVSDTWLASGHHVERGFALGYFDDTYLRSCRLHVVRDASGAVVAFANELPVYRDLGRRTVDLIRYKPGENGTMPFLLMQLIGQLHEEGKCQTFDLGFVPLAGVGSGLITIARRLAAGRFSSFGLEQFKNKFDPAWQPNFIAYDGDLIDLARITTGLEEVLKKTT